MPRPKRPGAPEPKRRSRNGCWPCKSRKIKCDEGHPQCSNCQKSGTECDFSVRLNWLNDGAYRPNKKRRPEDAESDPSTPPASQGASSPPKYKDPRDGDISFLNQFHFRPLGPTPSQGSSTPVAAAFPALVPISQPTPVISQPTPVFSPPVTSVAESLQATVAEEQVAHGILSRQDGISQPRSKQDVSGSYLGGDANSPGFGEDSSYGTGDALDTASSQLSPRKRHNHGFKPINRGNTTRLSSWSSSSTCAAESPSTRFLSHSRSVSYSAPSPLTTVSTPGGGDESCSSSKASTYAPSSPNIRRLSVQSLLASPHDPPYPNERTFSGPGRSSLSLLTRAITPETATFYGYDRGEPDKDLGQNVDEKVILGHSPVDTTGRHEFPSEETPRDNHPSDFGFGMRETRNYYERRVEVWISKELEPLPPKLRQSPMNLLYFHHFLNHTARVLVPHDDPRSNPFRTVLPQMAVKHDNLLSLLLAYSASHRARHLKYPEPSLRIADLVQGVISDLSTLVQQAMHDPNTLISTADLATAIMLASLEIVSPAAIGGSIPWHHHLNLARELISRMPDGLRRITPTSQDDRVRAFLWSWFAYLDVLGSLSGGPATLLTPACYTSASDTDTDVWDEDMERIDCILGFTPRCVFILARIAELARHTESIRSSHPDPFIIPSSILSAAATLETAALRSLAAPSRPCGHVHAPTPLRRWDRSQMAAANRAFHHAALIHLHRRVLGKGSGHPDVRGAAQSVLECLEHVERGSSAETCLLFPMFTAGCELVDEEERGVVLGRILGVERTGMTQVQRARVLMERVWEKGVPWERLVGSEFIG